MKKGHLIAFFLATMLFFWPPLRVGALIDESVVRVDCREKLVALTFDDGPHPRYTDAVLAMLKKYNIHATFFMIGVNVVNYPDVAKRVADAGNELANHTYSHPHLKNVGKQGLKEEIIHCGKVIQEVTGVTPVLFRPPEGFRGEEQCAQVGACGYRQILWNVDTNDWRGIGSNKIARTVMREVQGGDIVLFHDYIGGKYHSAEALDVIIPSLQKQGFRFVSVSELLSSGIPQPPNY